ncbi:hypothetical protein ACIA5H_34825 [Nocardia sp. NPDC051900]|uniref:hypothetical protein n=1 Tax=Nocardia sp. NPDC051900 TaxID=3364326 RepID=UPI0037B1BEB4
MEVFADGGGLVIDTRDLFLLDKAVAAGQVSAEEARGLLMGSVGLFEISTASDGLLRG